MRACELGADAMLHRGNELGTFGAQIHTTGIKLQETIAVNLHLKFNPVTGTLRSLASVSPGPPDLLLPLQDYTYISAPKCKTATNKR